MHLTLPWRNLIRQEGHSTCQALGSRAPGSWLITQACVDLIPGAA